MERYLLYDSGCSTCSKMARAIEQEVDGQLIARSLHDPDIQNLLNQANPHWQWKPTLLEVSDNTVRAHTGLAMGMRLVLELGPRQALRLVKLVNRYSVSAIDMGPTDPGRRHFLRQSPSAFAAIAVLLGWPNSQLFGNNIGAATPQQTTSHQALQEPTEGEIWEGFLLLPAIDAVWPSFVQCAPAPILGEVSGQYDPALRGEIVRFNGIEELTNYIPFPTYVPATLPPKVQFIGASVVQFAHSDDIFDATLNFGVSDTNQSRIRVRARPTYPRPYPVLPVHSPVYHEKQVIHPEKVTFTPSPGVIRPSASGHVIQWIRKDILYTLVAEHNPSREAAVEIARSLIQI